MATEGRLNLGGDIKREALVAAYGVGGFDYIGDHAKAVAIFLRSDFYYWPIHLTT